MDPPAGWPRRSAGRAIVESLGRLPPATDAPVSIAAATAPTAPTLGRAAADVAGGC